MDREKWIVKFSRIIDKVTRGYKNFYDGASDSVWTNQIKLIFMAYSLAYDVD